MLMELKKLKEEILEAIEKGIKEAIYQDDKYGSATVDTNDGYIDVSYWLNDGTVEVIIYHDNEDNKHPCYNDHERPCNNLADSIEEYVTYNVDISAIEEELEEEAYYDDIWHRNGFDSEADYNRYRYGSSNTLRWAI